MSSVESNTQGFFLKAIMKIILNFEQISAMRKLHKVVFQKNLNSCISYFSKSCSMLTLPFKYIKINWNKITIFRVWASIIQPPPPPHAQLLAGHLNLKSLDRPLLVIAPRCRWFAYQQMALNWTVGLVSGKYGVAVKDGIQLSPRLKSNYTVCSSNYSSPMGVQSSSTSQYSYLYMSIGKKIRDHCSFFLEISICTYSKILLKQTL